MYALLVWLLLSIASAQEPEVVLPQVLYEAPAIYPEEARAEGQQAVVQLEITLDAEGEVLDVTVLDAPSEAFADAAVASVEASRFSPATADGVSVGVTITYSVGFTLEAVAVPSIEGTVLQAGVRQPQPGVAVEALGPDDAVAYARSADDGTFTLYDLAPGTWTIRLTGPGLRPESTDLEVREGSVAELTMYAFQDRPWEDDGYVEIEVVDDTQPVEVTERRLSTVEAMALPGSNGDIVRAILNFPGVARPPLGIGQLIVRGNDADQTRYYVDGVRVPQVFHFGGLATVFNGDALSEIRFLTGNYSVRYGDGLGGVVDLVTDVAPVERSNGYVSIDVYQAAAFVEQKVDDKTSLTFSLRRSYADAVLGPILGELGGGRGFQAPRYWDASARVVHRRDDGGVLDALVLVSDDQFRLIGRDGENTLFGLKTTFVTTSLGWRQPFGDGWRTETRISAGPDRNGFTFRNRESFDEGVNVNVRQEFRKDVPEGDRLGRLGWRFGFDGRARAFRFRLGIPDVNPVDAGEGWQVRPSFYAESTVRLGPVDLIPGVRGALHMIPGTTLGYTVDPRFAIVGRVGPTSTLVGTVGRYSSFPEPRELLESSRGTPDLRTPWALQSSVGLQQQLPYDLSLEVTAFYNETYDLVSGREDRFEFASGPPGPLPSDTGPYANDGRARAYGAEILFRVKQERLNAWLSATVSRATRRARPDQDETLFQFDQTLVVNAIATWQLPKRWTIGGRLRVGTGNPYTPVINRVYDLGSRRFVPIFDDGTERLRAYWALDLRFDKTWVFKKWQLTLYVDIQGITDPGNQELFNYNDDYTEAAPIFSTPPLPAFGLKGAW